jgi:hypothetical protein
MKVGAALAMGRFQEEVGVAAIVAVPTGIPGYSIFFLLRPVPYPQVTQVSRTRARP